jgi:hypothetical protein
MKNNAIILAVVSIANLLIIIMMCPNTWKVGLLMSLLSCLAIAVVVAMLGLGIAWLVGGCGHNGQTGLMDGRVRAVFVVGVMVTYTFMVWMARLMESVVLIECIYYGMLIATGIALAWWCEARPGVIVPLAFIIVISIAVTYYVRFVNSSNVKFRYGPERYLFALKQLSYRLDALLVDSAVIFAAWKVALAIKGKITERNVQQDV